MAFVMTHLAIAKNINDHMNAAENLSDYYLGTISPDCVHVRKEYASNMKKASHFCVDDQGWGRITNNQEWRNQVLSLLTLYRNRTNHDFILGYFIHILVDICDNEKIYMPFKDKCASGELRYDDPGHAFYNDKSRNDVELYRFFDWKDDVCTVLEAAHGFGISPVIEAAETEAYRDVVLRQYRSGKSDYNDPNTFFSLSDNLRFIENASDEIVKLLRKTWWGSCGSGKITLQIA
jgi:hypothetical protein